MDSTIILNLFTVVPLQRRNPDLILENGFDHNRTRRGRTISNMMTCYSYRLFLPPTLTIRTERSYRPIRIGSAYLRYQSSKRFLDLFLEDDSLAIKECIFSDSGDRRCSAFELARDHSDPVDMFACAKLSCLISLSSS